jgi:hypothetical protein
MLSFVVWSGIAAPKPVLGSIGAPLLGLGVTQFRLLEDHHQDGRLQRVALAGTFGGTGS